MTQTIDLSTDLIAVGNAIAVNTEQDYLKAAEFLKAAATMRVTITDHYKPLKAAAQKAHKDVVAQEKKYIDPIDMVSAQVKGLMLGYRKRLEAAPAIEVEGSAIGFVAGIAPTVVGIGERVTYRAIVVDPNLVPREYLMPDQQALNDAAKRMKEGFNIPGCKLDKDENVTVRRG